MRVVANRWLPTWAGHRATGASHSAVLCLHSWSPGVLPSLLPASAGPAGGAVGGLARSSGWGRGATRWHRADQEAC